MMKLKKEDLIKKYESLEGVWNANGAEMARQCFLRDLEQLNEIDTKKVTVPQYVADWIEKCKNKEKSLLNALLYTPEKVNSWIGDSKNQETFTLAWINGYHIEEEKRYYVKLKAVDQYLVRNEDENFLGFLQSRLKSKFTRKQLEQAELGWVFDCPGIEIEEVEG